MASYDWLIFTSANGVRYFLERLDRSRQDLRALRARICAIGEATKSAVEALHLKVDLMGEEYVAESLVEAFRSIDLAGQAGAAAARGGGAGRAAARIAGARRVRGCRGSVPDRSAESAAKQAAEIFGGARKPDWITFTSSSTVQNFVQRGGSEGARGVKVASIGPVTTATAKKLGLDSDGRGKRIPRRTGSGI